MMRSGWTPYRIGVVIALAGWTGSIAFVALFILMVTGGFFSAWLFAAVTALGSPITILFRPNHRSRNHPARCPECHKSIFLLAGGESMPVSFTLAWPERWCSECGANLTGD